MSDDIVESPPRSTNSRRRKSNHNSTPKKKKKSKRRKRGGGGNSPSTQAQDSGSDRSQASPSSSAIHAAEAETDVSSAKRLDEEKPVESDTKEKVCPIISYVTALFYTVF